MGKLVDESLGTPYCERTPSVTDALSNDCQGPPTVAIHSTYLHGKLLHRSPDATFEEVASYHHCPNMIAKLLLQLVILEFARLDAGHQLPRPEVLLSHASHVGERPDTR